MVFSLNRHDNLGCYMNLDEVDVSILNMLIKDGRISYTDIAKAVGMKPPSIIDRIKRLESEGIIMNYAAHINYRKLNYDITAFVGIFIDNPIHLDDFHKELEALDDDIVECYHVTGEFTLLLKIITGNTNNLANIVKKVRTFTGVLNTNTILVFSTLLDRMHKV